jgi:hypothetical protein
MERGEGRARFRPKPSRIAGAPQAVMLQAGHFIDLVVHAGGPLP